MDLAQRVSITEHFKKEQYEVFAMDNLTNKLLVILSDWSSDPNHTATADDVAECFTDLYPQYSKEEVLDAINSALSDGLFSIEDGCLKLNQ